MLMKSLIKSKPLPSLTELPPLELDSEGIGNDFRCYYTYHLGRDKWCLSLHYAYKALVLTQRDRLMERWSTTRYTYRDFDCRYIA